MNNNMNQNQQIGQYELIIKDLNENTRNKKIKNLEDHIKILGSKIIKTDYDNEIMKHFIDWINKVRILLIKNFDKDKMYSFYKFDSSEYNLLEMSDYYDVPKTNKLFSFTLFINNITNLSYLVGLVYNYAIMRKHFTEYKMRLYVDFHSVLGSAETFNLFNMFLDTLNEIDSSYGETLQIVVFMLNPYYSVNNESIYEKMTTDIDDVKLYYNEILYNTNDKYVESPLLKMNVEKKNADDDSKINSSSTNNLHTESLSEKKDVKIMTEEDLEITYKNYENVTATGTFALLSCHISVNLRFLPMNEDCEYHVRDLDSRLSLSDKNIIEKFNNPKYEYVPYYVFQFYKFYFPYLKWRIDVNPYLAGCFGGDNRKQAMISKELRESGNLKILKKEMFFKYILFLTINATNLQVGFLNDEFVLANIFEKIKGKYSENVLYLNLGSYANKHVNEYYYGLNDSANYPCILKLGVPIDILRYPLNGKYLTIDPITDFKMGNIPLKYHDNIRKIICEQLKIYLGTSTSEKEKISNKIRKNYKTRLDDEIDNDLEAALFFSMIPKNYSMNGLGEFNYESYTFDSYKDQMFSSIGSSTFIVKNEKLKASNFMVAGYLLADVLEQIIFPETPEYINSNYYLSDDNYDRLFNCLYFDESKGKFLHKKIGTEDISRKYIDQNIIDKIPDKYLEFNNKEEAKKSLNTAFNLYLETCKYYSSMSYYITNIYFNRYIKIEDKLIKSASLIFIKDYMNPIYNKNNDVINKLNVYDVKTLKYDLSKNDDYINGVIVNKNKLKFNLFLLDDNFINQFTYHNSKNDNKVDIKLIKSSHLENLSNLMAQNNFNDFLIANNI
jgi:hypothetical protein